MEHAYQEGWKELKRTVKDKEQESRQELWVDARISLEKSVLLMK